MRPTAALPLTMAAAADGLTTFGLPPLESVATAAAAAAAAAAAEPPPAPPAVGAGHAM